MPPSSSFTSLATNSKISLSSVEIQKATDGMCVKTANMGLRRMPSFESRLPTKGELFMQQFLLLSSQCKRRQESQDIIECPFCKKLLYVVRRILVGIRHELCLSEIPKGFNLVHSIWNKYTSSYPA